ncbi:MAG: GNAT family N-acetyltransferase [Bryobacteraceae bacterium]
MIREATPEDLDRIQDIEIESFPHSAWLPSDFLRHPCVVAEEEGDIHGFLVSRQIAPEGDGHPAEREIINLAVKSGSRRRGIAASLLHHEMQKPAIFFLEVRASNVAAKALYKKLGFRELGYRFNYYENPRETAIVMTTRPL